MQLVVVIAVSAADSAAMTTRTMTSHTFFFSGSKLSKNYPKNYPNDFSASLFSFNFSI